VPVRFARASRFFFRWLLLPLLLWLFYAYIGTPARVDGSSMNPTLEDGEAVWLWRWVRLNPSWPDYGDVVATLAPVGSPPYSTETGMFGLERRTQFVKRVVGKPGDTLELRGGDLYRNGKRVMERYTSSDAAAFSSAPVTLKAGEYYLLGDNRKLGESIDSRFFGPVQRSDLLGAVSAVIWPPSNWGRVR